MFGSDRSLTFHQTQQASCVPVSRQTGGGLERRGSWRSFYLCEHLQRDELRSAPAAGGFIFPTPSIHLQRHLLSTFHSKTLVVTAPFLPQRRHKAPIQLVKSSHSWLHRFVVLNWRFCSFVPWSSTWNVKLKALWTLSLIFMQRRQMFMTPQRLITMC